MYMHTKYSSRRTKCHSNKLSVSPPQHNVIKSIAIFVTAVFLLNAMAPTLAHAEQDRLQAAIQTLNHKSVTVMVRGQIDSSQVLWNAYVHVVYTSKGKKENATGRVVNKAADSIIILDNQQYWKMAYNEIDTLRVAQNMRDIERYRELGAKYNARVRFKAPSVSRKRITGRLLNVTQDTLIIQSGYTFF